MKMTGEQRIAATRQRVWEALNDAEALRASIPGCQSLDQESATRFAATIEVKVGPIGARFKGNVSLADLDPPNGYTLRLEGNGGIAGSVKGNAKVRLRDDAGSTIISYDLDAQVGGRMAQLGGPLIDATAKQLAGRFFNRFGEIVGAASPTAEAASTTATPAFAKAGDAAAIHVAPSSALSRSRPMAWILVAVIAALAGFLLGRGHSAADSEWVGVAIGLLLIVVAAAAFEHGRRSAAPAVSIDRESLRRLLDGAKQ